LESEYTFVVDVIELMASAKSKVFSVVAGTSAGAAKLHRGFVSRQLIQTKRKRTLVHWRAGLEDSTALTG
jgi:predicted patatin/cPLA2 family phospholipase